MIGQRQESPSVGKWESQSATARAFSALPPSHAPTLLRLLGWLWRIAAGSVLAGLGLVLNFFLFSFLGSIAVLGWTYRWMQVVVLRSWWKQSPIRRDKPFDQFCESLGEIGPAPRPRWFVHQHFRQALAGPLGAAPSLLRRLGRWVFLPWHSFRLNFRLGLQALFCTYLVMGWGCLMMWVSWEFGWLNSFNQGYEQAYLGPLTGLLGSLLLILSLFYVPMAQAHQAATGEARTFFHFRLIWRLIQARTTAYVGLAALVTLVSILFEVLRVAVVSDQFAGNLAATDREGLNYLRGYLFGGTVALFVVLLGLRLLAAKIYQSAVLKALRLGWITPGELPLRLAAWLDRLHLTPEPVKSSGGLGQVMVITSRWSYRRFLYAVLFSVWLLFVIRFYAGYFQAANGFRGFISHPLIQFPCFDYVPWHLQVAAKE